MQERNKWFEIILQQNKNLRTEQQIRQLEAALGTVRKKELLEKTRGHFSEINSVLDILGAKYIDTLTKLRAGWRISNNSIEIYSDKLPIESNEAAQIKTNNEMRDCLKLVDQLLVLLSPWRKGPFKIFNTNIDSEWKSYEKWLRLGATFDLELLCKNKIILDVGSSNGFYSFCYLAAQAQLVLAIDPMPRNAYFFDLYRLLFSDLDIYFEEFKVQDLYVLEKSFHTIFCMGILYHQRDPLGMLEGLHKNLARKGILVLETICLNNNLPYCLIPEDRYLKARGYWFIPSLKVIETWLQKSGFIILAKSRVVKTELEEQHRTEWIRGESLEDFLDAKNRDYTVEGYPAPERVIYIAQTK